MLTSRSLASLLEIVLEATGHRLQIAHATRSLTTTTRTLQSPVVYTHQHHSIPFYSVSSSHRGNHKNRSGSSECDKHDDRIFCKSCGSYRVSYQMKKYLSSTITVSTSTTLHSFPPISFSISFFITSFDHSFTYHSLLRNTAILYQHQKDKRTVVSHYQPLTHHYNSHSRYIPLPSLPIHMINTLNEL